MPNDNFKFHIIGAGRGGTSLLAGLLDYHSKLEVGFELYSTAYLMEKELTYQGPELFLKRVSAYISACERKAHQHPSILWGNKITTEQIFGLEDHNTLNPDSKLDVLDQLFNNCLEGKAVIFILRDGRTCINSKVQRTGQSIEKACERWQYSVKCCKFFRKHHKNNICVRFEDILDHPRATLTKICDFLNVSFEEEMLKGTDNNKMRPEYRQNRLDVSKKKSITIPDNYSECISDDLKWCGYL